MAYLFELLELSGKRYLHTHFYSLYKDIILSSNQEAFNFQEIVLKQKLWICMQDFDTVYVLDVSGINNPLKFELKCAKLKKISKILITSIHGSYTY